VTAPPETKATSPPTPSDESGTERTDEWVCIRIVDLQRELICGQPATTEKLVRNSFGVFAVSLCASCARDHLRFYAALRAKGQRPRRH
jgi:hypothetical protein